MPRALLKASAAAWPVAASAADAAWLQASTVAAEALHLLVSWSQLNSAMTLMLRAEPWSKSAWSTASNESSLRPSKPAPNLIAGAPHEPKSRAARRILRLMARLAAPEAALQASSCASHCWTPPESWPLLAAAAQALCWTAHERCRAAPSLTKVEPSTEKGRSALAADETTGGGAPPRAPVKVWTFAPAAEAAVAEAPWELALALALEEAAAPAPAAEAAPAPEAAAAPAPAAPAEPATAAEICAAETAGVRRFCELMQPLASVATSQVLPLAVGSPI